MPTRYIYHLVVQYPQTNEIEKLDFEQIQHILNFEKFKDLKLTPNKLRYLYNTGTRKIHGNHVLSLIREKVNQNICIITDD